MKRVSKSKAERKPIANKTTDRILSKEFTVKHRSMKFSFDVLLINDIAVYDDAALTALRKTDAKRIEKLLDRAIASYLNCSELETIATVA